MNVVRPASSFSRDRCTNKFGGGVDGAGGFIEHEDARVGQEGAGEADELPLAQRHVGAALADIGLVAFGQSHD